MICKKCGADISDDSAFCPKCGKKLNSSPSTLNAGPFQNNISSEHRNIIIGIVFFIAAIIFVCFITSSHVIAFGICICSFLLFPILLITGIVKKILKKPSGKPLYFSGLFFAVFCISLVNHSLNMPATAVQKSKRSTEESVDTTISESISVETTNSQSILSDSVTSAGNIMVTEPLSTAEETISETETVQTVTNYSTENYDTATSNYSAASNENNDQISGAEETKSETQAVQAMTNYSTENSDATTSHYSEASDEKNNHISSDLWLMNCSDFSEGRAWVQFNDEEKKYGKKKLYEEYYNASTGDDKDKIEYLLSKYLQEGSLKAAVIDTEGNIIWESELTRSENVLTEKSEFKDGLAYCIFSGNNGDMYYIIDSEGNVTYKTEASENYRIICHSDGKFFVAKHISNFDTDEWQLGVIDKNGKVISPFKEYSKVYENEEIPDPEYDSDIGYIEDDVLENLYGDPGINSNDNKVIIPLNKDNIFDCCYLGNDILELSYTIGNNKYVYSGIGICLLNVKNQSIIYLSEKDGYMTRYSDFEDGKAVILKDSFLGEMDTEGNITKILSNTWTSKVLGYNFDFSEGLAFIPLSQMSEQYDDFTFKNGVYYDTKGNIAIDFEQYRGKHSYDCGQFSNGYAVMSIKGSDGKNYYTIINKKGEQMFEPISGYTDFKLSNDSKYICAFYTYSIDIYDISGKKISTIKSKAFGANTNRIVNDGMMNISDCYINVKTGQIIGSGKFTLSDLNITVY